MFNFLSVPNTFIVNPLVLLPNTTNARNVFDKISYRKTLPTATGDDTDNVLILLQK